MRRGIAPGFERPPDLSAALAALAGGSYRVLAGGTDLYATGRAQPPAGALLDISGLEELRGIRQEEGGLRIGALATWTEIASEPLPPYAAALALAAREVGGRQVQNRGTVGGNLCNASPAADGVPALLALGASVELASAAGRRRLALDGFLLGSRRTALRGDELLVAVHVPARSAAARSVFLKLGARRYLVISIAAVAVVLDFDGAGRVSFCGAAVGACAETARRLPALEARLLGTPRAEVQARATRFLGEAEALAPLSPIDDVRASAAYRREAVRALLARAFAELAP